MCRKFARAAALSWHLPYLKNVAAIDRRRPRTPRIGCCTPRLYFHRDCSAQFQTAKPEVRSLRNLRCARLNDKPSFRALAARCARGVQESLAQKQRARGKPGVRCTRGRAWCVVNTRVSHHRFTGSIRLSPRNGFNGFLRALPGDRACLSPSPVALSPLT